jgi:hypothetical protein
MNKIKAYIGLKLIRFGILVYESEPFGLLDDEDKVHLKRLWEYHDKFERILK